MVINVQKPARGVMASQSPVLGTTLSDRIGLWARSLDRVEAHRFPIRYSRVIVTEVNKEPTVSVTIGLGRRPTTVVGLVADLERTTGALVKVLPEFAGEVVDEQVSQVESDALKPAIDNGKVRMQFHPDEWRHIWVYDKAFPRSCYWGALEQELPPAMLVGPKPSLHVPIPPDRWMAIAALCDSKLLKRAFTTDWSYLETRWAHLLWAFGMNIHYGASDVVSFGKSPTGEPYGRQRRIAQVVFRRGGPGLNENDSRLIGDPEVAVRVVSELTDLLVKLYGLFRAPSQRFMDLDDEESGPSVG